MVVLFKLIGIRFDPFSARLAARKVHDALHWPLRGALLPAGAEVREHDGAIASELSFSAYLPVVRGVCGSARGPLYFPMGQQGDVESHQEKGKRGKPCSCGARVPKNPSSCCQPAVPTSQILDAD